MFGSKIEISINSVFMEHIRMHTTVTIFIGKSFSFFYLCTNIQEMTIICNYNIQ